MKSNDKIIERIVTEKFNTSIANRIKEFDDKSNFILKKAGYNETFSINGVIEIKGDDKFIEYGDLEKGIPPSFTVRNLLTGF